MHLALCKEQQHSQKQDFFVISTEKKKRSTYAIGLGILHSTERDMN
jgi:hypothetical protein